MYSVLIFNLEGDVIALESKYTLSGAYCVCDDNQSFRREIHLNGACIETLEAGVDVWATANVSE